MSEILFFMLKIVIPVKSTMNKTNKFINKVTFSSEEEELFRRLEEDDSLGTCVIYSSGLMNNKGEFASIPPFIELAGGEKVVLNREVNPRNISEVVEGAREIVNCLENLEKMCNPMEESSDVGLLDSSFIPFTYIFVPKGEESLARKLIFDSLGDLTAEQLKKIHFLKREKTEKERSFGFKVEKNITSPNFFFTDPSYQEVTMPILAG
ncbi:5268_t:CDS:2 [Funneliformis geosporum]|nr:5268_t:CDS:2 [Funneliformis geosporum]